MLTEKLNQVSKALVELNLDAEKADKGNKAAARRVRVAVQEVKKLLQEVRQESFRTGEQESVEV